MLTQNTKYLPSFVTAAWTFNPGVGYILGFGDNIKRLWYAKCDSTSLLKSILGDYRPDKTVGRR